METDPSRGMTPPPPSDPRLPQRREWTSPAFIDEPGPACLDEDTLGALAEGSLDEPTRSAVLPHVAECARCRSTVASLSRALADPDLSREIEQVTPRSRSWRGILVTAILAAAIVMVLLVPPELFRNPAPGTHRAGETIVEVPGSLVPTGVVAAVDELRWSGVEGAARYRVTLFDRDGRVLFEANPTGASVALPDSVSLLPGTQYLWKVEAQVAAGRSVSSELVSFTLRGPRP